MTELPGAGINVIQIDEPALREGLPSRHSDWGDYSRWAGEALRLSAGSARDETQSHRSVCSCEFNEILDSIAALDADVISNEAARSNMELLRGSTREAKSPWLIVRCGFGPHRESSGFVLA